ncbi:hypothetical protein [Tahibacter amnicola]|uniref:Uncharacterized protein n=1 Tax=Tahibacter amnicola TaxID=2976241 RepID=A0ABY6BKV7_9GAMM|nr:hypothetical protein [Tahibacter amnicola]UXI70048.1 hypothetical protein N4264_10605 [Tahibacter amnicola]
MKKHVMVLACLSLLAGNAFAQGTITSGAANYVIAAGHFDASPGVNFTGVGTNDQLFEAGWWFRVDGDSQEAFFPAPDTQNYNAAAATLNWANVGGRGFSAVKTHVVASPGSGAGETTSTMTVTNTGSSPVTLHLFHMADIDVNGTAGTDTAAVVDGNNRYLRINDATQGQCEYRAPGSVAFMVRPWVSGATDVPGLLSDTTITSFDNSGLPFTGDFTGGFQWTLTLAAGAQASVTAYVACNTAATPVSLMQYSVD